MCKETVELQLNRNLPNTLLRANHFIQQNSVKIHGIQTHLVKTQLARKCRQYNTPNSIAVKYQWQVKLMSRD